MTPPQSNDPAPPEGPLSRAIRLARTAPQEGPCPLAQAFASDPSAASSATLLKSALSKRAGRPLPLRPEALPLIL